MLTGNLRNRKNGQLIKLDMVDPEVWLIQGYMIMMKCFARCR